MGRLSSVEEGAGLSPRSTLELSQCVLTIRLEALITGTPVVLPGVYIEKITAKLHQGLADIFQPPVDEQEFLLGRLR